MTEAASDLVACPRIPGALRLSTASCARSYKAGKSAEPWETAHHCLGCEIGARHAGEKIIVVPPPRHVCVRCGTHSRRLVGKLVCISCFNRQREYIIGANARGSAILAYRVPAIWDTELGIQIGHDASEVETVCQRLMDGRPAWLENYGTARPAEIREWWHGMVIPHSTRRNRLEKVITLGQAFASRGGKT